MNATSNAVRAGLRRGRTEFAKSIRAPEDLTYYAFGTAIFLVIMWLNRANEVEGAGISLALLLFPGVLAFTTVFAAAYGLATVVTTEREDGTLLRAKSVPHGMRGYVVGQTTRTSLEVGFNVLLLAVPASVIVPGLWDHVGVTGALRLVGVLLLGLVACVPIGFVIGSVFKNPRSVGGWGMLVMAGLVFVSGVFFPLTQLAGWVQVVGQVTPLYWLGLGVRGAMLPDSAVAIEVGQSWRMLETVGVLGLWAVVGLLVAPVLLRRMARRESGSSVAARREKQLQRV